VLEARTFFASAQSAADGSSEPEAVGEKQRPIINYSGGTESGGGILVSYPFLPREPASFNRPLPAWT
jgi:hypothetical protein